jgi:hypothetical protein
MAPNDVAQVENLQGLLAADGSSGAASRGVLGAISNVRRSSEPDESQYLHNLRVDVHDGDEGPLGYYRSDDLVCRSERIHQPVSVVSTGCDFQSARRFLR